MSAELFVYGNVTDLDVGCPAVHVIYMADGTGSSAFVTVTDGTGGLASDLLTAGVDGTVAGRGFDHMDIGLEAGATPTTTTISADGFPDLIVRWHDPTDPLDSVGCPSVGSFPPGLTGVHLSGDNNSLTWSPVVSGDAHFPAVVYTLNRAPDPFPLGGPETSVYLRGPGTSFLDTPPADTTYPFDDVWYYRAIGFEPIFGYGTWSNIVALGPGTTPPPPAAVKAWGVLAR